MRRDKAWWARLTKEERAELVYLERCYTEGGSGGSAYLPEGYSDCCVCSTPTEFGGYCKACYERWKALVAKGNGETP